MKKWIALLLSMLMVFSSIVASAGATEDFMEILEKIQSSKAYAFTAEVSLNIEELPAILSEVDPEALAMLDALKITLDSDVHMESAEKIQMFMDLGISIPDGEIPNMKYWIDMDLAADAPVYKVIMEDPTTPGHYMYMDYTKSGMIDLTAMKDLIAQSEELTKDTVALYTDVAVITKEGDIYKVEISAEGLKQYMAPIWEKVVAMMPVDSESAEMAEVMAIFEQIGSVEIFGDPAFTETYTVDVEKTITAQSAEIFINTKISDWAEAFGVPEAESGLNAENSALKGSIKVDITNIDYTCDEEIAFPVLTPENSTDLLAPVYDESKININVDGVPVVFDVEPVQMYDTTLVPIRKFCNAIGVADEDITYTDENGVEVVNIKMTDKEITLTIDSKIALVNGEEKELIAPAVIIDDRTLVPLRFISENFDMDVIWTPFYHEGTEIVNGCVIDINHK